MVLDMHLCCPCCAVSLQFTAFVGMVVAGAIRPRQ